MTPLLLFLLGVLAVYVSTVATAFSALMRLSLRLMAERGDRDDALGRYLDEPLRLFIPTRLMLALITVAAVTLIARVTSLDFARGVPMLLLSSAVFVLVCEMIIPLAIVRRDPERVLEVLLPSFEAITRLLRPLTAGLRRLAGSRRDRTAGALDDGRRIDDTRHRGNRRARPRQSRAISVNCRKGRRASCCARWSSSARRWSAR